VAGTGISVSGATGSVTITNIGVQSFNGNTGAVTGASLGANTFTALNSFNAGISAAGGVTLSGTLSGATATFSGDIAVNGGDITTTATTATIFNSTATTVSMGGANDSTINIGAGTGVTLNIGTGSLFGGTKNINIGTNGSFGTSIIQIGNSIAAITINSGTAGITLGSGTSPIRIPNTLTVGGGVTLSGRVDVGGVLDVVGGVTFESTSDHVGVARFANTTAFSGLGSFNAGISAAGGTFSAPTRFTAGISASGGITFNSNVTITNTLNVSSIVSDGQVSIEDTSNARVSIGDYSYNANSTYIFLRDTVTTLHLSNPFGTIDIGDPNSIDSGNFISYSATDSTLYGNSNSLNGFSDLSTNYVFASLGISAAGGVTFSGTVSSDTGYRITSSAINAQTGTTYTFLTSDNGKIVTFNSGSAVTVTIPTGLPTGFNCTAIQLGTGQVGFTAASGLTMNSYGNQYRLIGQHASASIIEYTANTVNLSGNLVV
jgi:hypothetical protein